MIRKALIIILSMLAVATLAAGAASVGRRIEFGSRDSGKATVLGAPPELPESGQALYSLTLVEGYLYLGRRCLFSKQKPETTLRLGVFFYYDESSSWDDGSTLAGGAALGPPYYRLTILSIRLWALLILFSVYPTIAFIRGPLRRYRRRRKGLCLKCGYDLTGNVTGVCSECGQDILQGEA